MVKKSEKTLKHFWINSTLFDKWVINRNIDNISERIRGFIENDLKLTALESNLTALEKEKKDREEDLNLITSKLAVINSEIKELKEMENEANNKAKAEALEKQKQKGVLLQQMLSRGEL